MSSQPAASSNGMTCRRHVSASVSAIAPLINSFTMRRRCHVGEQLESRERPLRRFTLLDWPPSLRPDIRRFPARSID